MDALKSSSSSSSSDSSSDSGDTRADTSADNPEIPIPESDREGTNADSPEIPVPESVICEHPKYLELSAAFDQVAAEKEQLEQELETTNEDNTYQERRILDLESDIQGHLAEIADLQAQLGRSNA